MKGLDLSRKFYIECGAPMLNEQFDSVLPYLAVGLVGSGSECLGFDDEVSQDHDFEPAFCIFVPDEIDSKTCFELERAYSKLPRAFLGFERSTVNTGRHGVIRIGDFFKSKTGRRNGELSLSDWFSVPEYSLKEATNGEVFFDNYGLFTEIRKRLSYFPEDIRLKKLAGNLFLMGQAGRYNYSRCIERKDSAAAQMAVFEFVKSALSAIFLLNKTYAPYYKWSFRALNELKCLSELSQPLEYLISSGNSADEAENKARIIEEICASILAQLKVTGLVKSQGGDVQTCAQTVNNLIKDISIRNLHILAAV